MSSEPSADLVTAGLGAVSRARLQAAMNRWRLGDLVAAEPATTGNFGQNIFATTSQGQFVFRGNPNAEGQLGREQYFAQVFKQQCSVPAPWPYHYEPDPSLFGWPYAVMGHVAGVQIAEQRLWSSLQSRDRSAIAAELGHAAAEITAVLHPYAGRWMPDSASVKPFVSGWSMWVRSTILEQASQSAALGPRDLSWIDTALERAAPFLERPFHPVLVHGDFSRHNATASRDGVSWTIAGVYDLASCHYGHPAEILTRQFADFSDHEPELVVPFTAAALNHSNLLATHCEDPDGLTALILLERMGIWEWAHRVGKGWWPRDLGFIDWINRYRETMREALKLRRPRS